MTSIFEGQPHKTRPFPSKTRVIWVPGIYIYIHIIKSSPSIGLFLHKNGQVLSDPRSRAEYDAELRTRGVEAGSFPAKWLNVCFYPAD